MSYGTGAFLVICAWFLWTMFWSDVALDAKEGVSFAIFSLIAWGPTFVLIALLLRGAIG